MNNDINTVVARQESACLVRNRKCYHQTEELVFSLLYFSEGHADLEKFAQLWPDLPSYLTVEIVLSDRPEPLALFRRIRVKIDYSLIATTSAESRERQ